MPRLSLRMLAPRGMAFGLYVNNAAAGVGAVGGGALSAFARPSPVQTVQAGECWNENGPDGPGLLSVRRWRGRPHRRPRWPWCRQRQPLACLARACGRTWGQRRHRRACRRASLPGCCGQRTGGAPHGRACFACGERIGGLPHRSARFPTPGLRRRGRCPYWRACLTRPRGRSWRRRGRRRRPGGRHRTSVSARNGLDVRSDQQASVVPSRVRQQTAAPKIFDEGVHQAADHRYGREDGREHIEANEGRERLDEQAHDPHGLGLRQT